MQMSGRYTLLGKGNLPSLFYNNCNQNCYYILIKCLFCIFQDDENYQQSVGLFIILIQGLMSLFNFGTFFESSSFEILILQHYLYFILLKCLVKIFWRLLVILLFFLTVLFSLNFFLTFTRSDFIISHPF